MLAPSFRLRSRQITWWLINYWHRGRSGSHSCSGGSRVSRSGGGNGNRDATVPDQLCSTLYARVLLAGVVNYCALWGASCTRDWVSGGVGHTAEKGC